MEMMDSIQKKIYQVREETVMLDRDLAVFKALRVFENYVRVSTIIMSWQISVFRHANLPAGRQVGVSNSLNSAKGISKPELSFLDENAAQRRWENRRRIGY